MSEEIPASPSAAALGSVAPAQMLREFVRLYLFHQRRLAHEEGLPPKGRMLMQLWRYGPLTQSEFGRHLGLEKSWVSRGVEHLVEEGWVERLPLETDRRCVRLAVTPQGREQAQQLEDCFNRHAAALFAHIPAEQHADIAGSLQALIGVLEALEPAAAGKGGAA